MNNRIKAVRLALSEQRGKKLSRQVIADELEVSLSNIESYELGRRSPSIAFIKLFCDKYNVNEEWLRTGEGEMFKPLDREAEIAILVKDMLKEEEDSFKSKLIKVINGLHEEQLEVLQDICNKLANNNSPC